MQKIRDAILAFCSGKRLKTTDPQIDMTARSLAQSGYPAEEIVNAIRELFSETPFFPDASMVLKKLRPSPEMIKAEANFVAGEIISRLGAAGEYKAFMSGLSPAGRFVVQKMGGWSIIKSTETGILRAQLRDMALSIFHALKPEEVPLKNIKAARENFLNDSGRRKITGKFPEK